MGRAARCWNCGRFAHVRPRGSWHGGCDCGDMQLHLNSSSFGRLVIAGATLGATLLSLAPAVHANCALPEGKIVWSYPAEGETDVPVNADITLLMSNWRRPASIELNGETVTGGEQGRYDPGTLEPNTAYTVSVVAEGDGLTAEVTLELHFTTGTDAVDASPVAPVVTQVASEDSALDFTGEPCPAALAAQDCFDTGQDSLTRLTVSGDEAVAWIVHALPGGEEPGPEFGYELWPAECGSPTLVGHDTRGGGAGCYFVTAVDAAGQQARSERFCIGGEAMPAGGGGDAAGEPGGDAGVNPSAGSEAGGCSAAGGGPGAPVASLLALALVALRRRRRGGGAVAR